MPQYINTILGVLAIVGSIETLVLIVGIVYAIVLWAKGISPALYRLGSGLAKRKIAIFAKGDNVASLKSLLTDSGLFKDKNICEIRKKEDTMIRYEQITSVEVFEGGR